MRLFVLFFLLVGLLGVSGSGAETSQEDSQVSRGEVGSSVSPFELEDYQGVAWQLVSPSANDKLTLVVFLGTECPLVQLYTPKLNALQADYGEQLRVVGIDANQQDSLSDLEQFAKKHEIQFQLLKDPGNRVADLMGAERTPEAYLLDANQTIRYRGRLDDQYTYGLQRPKVQRDYIGEAIAATLAGEPVEISRTEVVGCHIGRLLEPEADAEVTYTNQISRLLQKHCVSCHREGEIGPFSLTDYDEVVGWAEMIAEVIHDERMPPWHASEAHGKFSNDARLTPDEKQLVSDWIDAGAPQGDPAQLPPPLEFVEGWQIGEPDLVVEMASQPFRVPATGTIPYEYFVVDPGFTEDVWIKAAECRPGNRSVVHHIIVGIADQNPQARGERRGQLHSEWLCATAPGARPMQLPAGFAKKIPAGSKLLFQMHYTPNGREAEDLSKVGFVFARPEEVQHEVFTQQAVNTKFEIPAGAANHRVDSQYRFGEDSVMMTMFPHMHLRGKSFRYIANYPDGTEEILLDVPRYDFNWQNAYVFEEPKEMPKGTILKCVAHFDNSADNFANPDPTRPVFWGDQTEEEMMIGYFDMYRKRADGPGVQAPPQE